MHPTLPACTDGPGLGDCGSIRPTVPECSLGTLGPLQGSTPLACSCDYSGKLPILLSQALSVCRLRFSGHEAIIEDMLQLLPNLHVGLASEADLAVKGQNAPGVRGVHHDVRIEAWRQESTHVGEADGHAANIIGEAQCAEGLHFAVGIVLGGPVGLVTTWGE